MSGSHSQEGHSTENRPKAGRDEDVELKDDLLRGAQSIAEVLGCTPRTVYHLAEHGGVPIWREPGLGLVARRSAIKRYFEHREQQTVRQKMKER